MPAMCQQDQSLGPIAAAQVDGKSWFSPAGLPDSLPVLKQLARLAVLKCAVVIHPFAHSAFYQIILVRVNPDYEILFRLMDRLRPVAGRRYWIRDQGVDGNIVGTGEEMGQMGTEVKIAFPMSHTVLMRAEE